MIKTNELRQGSLVYAYGEQLQCAILSLMQIGSDVRADIMRPGSPKDNPGFTFVKYEDMEPIPLTSEVIGKCKSNSQVLRYEVGLNKMVIEIDDLKAEISTPEPIDGIRESSSFAKVPIIEYLHQLQNLFFALTGQELEVKL
jgi:hypothetical protein